MFKTFLKFLLNIKTYIILASIAVMGSNMFYLFVYGMRQHIHPTEWVEPGDQFRKFRPFLDGEFSVGYLTNEPQKRENNDGFFLQAQYYLAPTIVQLNDPDNKYNIVDSEDINYIRFVFTQTNSKKVTNNPYGQALIVRQ
jgi:hypothetical protein